MDGQRLLAGCVFLIIGAMFVAGRNTHNSRGAMLQITGSIMLALGAYLLIFSVEHKDSVDHLRAVFN